MRERVRLYGGRVESGPRPDGGYVVRAYVPIGSGGHEPAHRVLIADDQPMVRAGLRMILELEPDIDIVGEAADGNEAVAVAGEHAPGRHPDGRADAATWTVWRRLAASSAAGRTARGY